MTVKKTDTQSAKITPVSFSNNSSKNNINILTHTQDGKPLQRDKKKDFVANFKYHEAFVSKLREEWANLYTNICVG